MHPEVTADKFAKAIGCEKTKPVSLGPRRCRKMRGNLLRGETVDVGKMEVDATYTGRHSCLSPESVEALSTAPGTARATSVSS